MNKFIADCARTFGSSFVNHATGIVAGIVLARYLGPIGKGYIAYAAICVQLIGTATGGIAQAVTYQYGACGLPAAAVYKAMRTILACVAAVGAAILVAIALSAPSQTVLLWAALVLPFALYVQAASGIMYAANRVSATNVQSLILGTVYGVLTLVAVVAFGSNYQIVLGVWAGSYIAAAFYSWWILRPYVSQPTPTSRAILWEQLTFGGKTSAAQLATMLNMRIDIFVVSAALGAVALGVYTLAVAIGELLWQLSTPFMVAAFPRITTAPPAEAAAFTAKLIRHILALVAPAGALLWVLAPTLITALYGSAFREAGGALRWLMLGMVAYAAEAPLGYYLLVRLKRPGLILLIQGTSAVVCAAITLATVRSFGILGAAAATTITYLAVVIVKACIFHRATGISPAKLLFIDLDELREARGLAIRMLGRLRPARAT